VGSGNQAGTRHVGSPTRDLDAQILRRHALTKHRPALQETYRRHFRERGVAAMVFPTTPLPAAKIGEDYAVMLNGVPVSTLSTLIRNLAPGSTVGIPGLSLPAGMTKAGLPVAMAIDAPEKSDHQLLARVWPNTFVEPVNLTVQVASIRRALGDGRGDHRFLINISGRADRFVTARGVRGIGRSST